MKSEMSSTKFNTCVPDVNSYKGLTARWTMWPGRGIRPPPTLGLPRVQTEIWMLDASTSSSRVRIRDALMLVGVRIPLPSQRNLKAWWQALTPQQQCAWYLKKQQLAPGSKRRYDDIHHIGRATDQAADIEDEVDK